MSYDASVRYYAVYSKGSFGNDYSGDSVVTVSECSCMSLAGTCVNSSFAG